MAQRVLSELRRDLNGRGQVAIRDRFRWSTEYEIGFSRELSHAPLLMLLLNPHHGEGWTHKVGGQIKDLGNSPMSHDPVVTFPREFCHELLPDSLYPL